MKKALLFMFVCVATYAKAQVGFTNSNNLFTNANNHSGCSVTVVDWDGDGLDDIVRLDQGHDVWVDVQKTNNQFVSIHLGDFGGSAGWAWAMAVADVDQNGYKDIVAGGGGGSPMKILMVNGTGTGGTISNFQHSNFFQQNLTFGDFNNDGWIDLYACDDNNVSKVYVNDGAGVLQIMAASLSAATIGIGPKTITVQTNLTTLSIGQTVLVGNSGQNYMTGTITAYTAASGVLSVNVTSVTGSGAFNSWTVHPTMVFNHSLNPTVFYSGDPADSGNYGSAWIDYDNDGDLDLYVAHCRQSTTNPADLRRINRMFVNDGTGKFTENAAASGLAIGWQTWTPSFGDIDNDGDLDLLATNHDHESQILLNTNSVYTDITTSSLFDITDITPIESVMADFDNDGFVDIFVSGSDERFWRNNGNGTFTRIDNLFDNEDMESFAIGDLNHDGFIDIFGSYANIYTTPTTINDVIWLNNGNTNKFITFDLQGTVSNQGAIGTRVSIYGAWGVQIREVRSGESYGTVNSFMCHFGLGTASIIDSAVIDWPSGIHQVLNNPTPNQFVKVIENDCVSPTAIITPAGSLTFCANDSVMLSAPAGYSYLWSTGSTNPSIYATSAGDFNVVVTAIGNNCSGTSANVQTTVNNSSAPVITASSATEFCAGGSVTLTAPSGAISYDWVGGGNTSSISVTAGGSYNVDVVDVCGSTTSNTIDVTVHTPAVVTQMNVTLPISGSATLTSPSANTNWFDVAVGGTAIGTGASFVTPIVAANTVFYAESFESFGGGPASGGKTYSTGTYSGDNTLNAYTIFTVNQSATLNSVKVYTDQAGIRRFELRNSANAVLDYIDVNLPLDSTVVNLNFTLNPGTAYRLATNSVINTANLGYNGPRLSRENSASAVTYPYNIGSAVSITGNSYSTQYYAYFYDWKINIDPTQCLSTRVADTVFVTCPTPLPPVAILGSNTVCAGETETYTIAAVSGATSYNWILPSGWIGSSNGTSIDITPDASGTITVKAVNGCGESIAQVLSISVTNINTTLTQDQATLSAFVDVGATYQWINCIDNNILSGETNSDFTPTSNGAYAAIITKNGCIDTTECITINLSIESVQNGFEFEASPNPSKGKFTLLVNSIKASEASLIIVDALGREIYRSKVSLIVGKNKLETDLSGQSEGIYFVTLKEQNESRILKIALQK